MSKSDKDKLAEGAKAIHQAKREAAAAKQSIAVKQPDTLSGIVKELARLHRENLAAAYATLDRGVYAGELLYKAKALVEHGAWLPWLKQHAPFTVRTAQNYMRCYERRDELKTKKISHLNRAYSFFRQLADKKEIELEKPKLEHSMMSPAEEEVIAKGIARDEREARAIVEKREEAEPEDVPCPNGEPVSPEQPPQKGWTPDVLAKDDLTPEELEIVAQIERRPEGRRNVLKRFLCEGGVL